MAGLPKRRPSSVLPFWIRHECAGVSSCGDLWGRQPRLILGYPQAPRARARADPSRFIYLGSLTGDPVTGLEAPKR